MLAFLRATDTCLWFVTNKIDVYALKSKQPLKGVLLHSLYWALLSAVLSSIRTMTFRSGARCSVQMLNSIS